MNMKKLKNNKIVAKIVNLWLQYKEKHPELHSL